MSLDLDNLSPRAARKRLLVYKNGEFRQGGGVEVYISVLQSVDELLKAAGERLHMSDARRAFTSDGTEIDDLMLVGDDDIVFVSNGEGFKQSAVDDSAGTVVDSFRLVRYLGKGAYGKVYQGQHQLTGESVALKFISKFHMSNIGDAERITTEIHCLESLHHDNVIQLYKVLNTSSDVVLVFEYAGGGDLRSLVRSKTRLGEEEACRLFSEIAEGVSYCHRHHIVHHDLKLENILLSDSGHAKIADFGLSSFYRPGSTSTSTAGSLAYISPEVLKEGSAAGPPRDCWSLGIILFAMVVGRLPFEAKSNSKLIRQISSGSYTYDSASTPSRDCRDLISRLLTVDPDARAGMSAVKLHPWTTKFSKATTNESLTTPRDRHESRRRAAAAAAAAAHPNAATSSASNSTGSGSTPTTARTPDAAGVTENGPNVAAAKTGSPASGAASGDGTDGSLDDDEVDGDSLVPAEGLDHMMERHKHQRRTIYRSRNIPGLLSGARPNTSAALPGSTRASRAESGSGAEIVDPAGHHDGLPPDGSRGRRASNRASLLLSPSVRLRKGGVWGDGWASGGTNRVTTVPDGEGGRPRTIRSSSSRAILETPTTPTPHQHSARRLSGEELFSGKSNAGEHGEGDSARAQRTSPRVVNSSPPTSNGAGDLSARRPTVQTPGGMRQSIPGIEFEEKPLSGSLAISTRRALRSRGSNSPGLGPSAAGNGATDEFAGPVVPALTMSPTGRPLRVEPRSLRAVVTTDPETPGDQPTPPSPSSSGSPAGFALRRNSRSGSLHRLPNAIPPRRLGGPAGTSAGRSRSMMHLTGFSPNMSPNGFEWPCAPAQRLRRAMLAVQAAVRFWRGPLLRGHASPGRDLLRHTGSNGMLSPPLVRPRASPGLSPMKDPGVVSPIGLSGRLGTPGSGSWRGPVGSPLTRTASLRLLSPATSVVSPMALASPTRRLSHRWRLARVFVIAVVRFAKGHVYPQPLSALLAARARRNSQGESPMLVAPHKASFPSIPSIHAMSSKA